MTFPPPNFTFSPYVVKSFSTSTIKSVSARRTLSPTVGPNICAYAARFIRWGISIASSVAAKSPLRKLRQWSHDLLVEAVSKACAAVGDQRHLTGLSRLESHGGARGNVEAVTNCCIA